MGRECLARPAGDLDRLDFGRDRKAAGHPAQLGALSPCPHRRATLIPEQLPKVSAKPLVFGTPAPAAPLGSWTLLDSGTVLAAPYCTSPFPNGEVDFVEDRAGPPSRAYLKLWEA